MLMDRNIPVGRFAPSPTGLLHAGNAWTFLLAWLASRSFDGRMILRIEDLDPERSQEKWTAEIIKDLTWLGLDWDEGPGKEGSNGPYRQSLRSAYYAEKLDTLKCMGKVYPCFCTRKELREVAGAPHGPANGIGYLGVHYPGTCRYLTHEQQKQHVLSGRNASLRLLCPDGEEGRIRFSDLICGPQSSTLEECGGDFVLCRSDGVWAYQLAVVCDDIAMGINQVIRGNDILGSTPRQLELYRLFDEAPPQFAHVPLVCDHNGERLAKRHRSLSIAAIRDRGVKAEELVGWFAWQAGLQECAMPVKAKELLDRLREAGGMPWKELDKKSIIIPADAFGASP
jgi:glutamyl-tRNA synthetase